MEVRLGVKAWVCVGEFSYVYVCVRAGVFECVRLCVCGGEGGGGGGGGCERDFTCLKSAPYCCSVHRIN